MVAASRPGWRWVDVLRAGQAAYRDAGFDGEWREHVQGGPIGYLSREFDVVPGRPGAAEVITPGTAFAWNPTVRGAKSEDTFVVTDMLRITDGRMSGTGFGTVVLHVAPESAVGGPLSRLRDGDLVSLDAHAGSLSVSADLASREPVLPAVSDVRGWPVLHRMHVLQAPKGCDYDFLAAQTPDQLTFVEPVIGRS